MRCPAPGPEGVVERGANVRVMRTRDATLATGIAERAGFYKPTYGVLQWQWTPAAMRIARLGARVERDERHESNDPRDESHGATRHDRG